MIRAVLFSILFSAPAMAIKPALCGGLLPPDPIKRPIDALDNDEHRRFSAVVGPRGQHYSSPTESVIYQMTSHSPVATEFEVTARPGKVGELSDALELNFGKVRVAGDTVVLTIDSQNVGKFVRLIANERVPVAQVLTSGLVKSATPSAMASTLRDLVRANKISTEDSELMADLIFGGDEELILEIKPENASVANLGAQLTAAGLPLDALNAVLMLLVAQPKRVEKYYVAVKPETVGMVVEGLRVATVVSARIVNPRSL